MVICHPSSGETIVSAHSVFQIRDDETLQRFRARFAIPHDPAQDRDKCLETLCRAFARIPFENLSKIVKAAETGSAARRKRLPDDVLRDFLQYGTGGTCFSLNAAFIAVLRHAGVRAYPMLCDRRYGADTHAAVLIRKGRQLFLVDPGFLIFAPQPLAQDVSVQWDNGFNTLELIPGPAGRLELYTIRNGQRTYRLTYKLDITDEAAFVRAWEESFTFAMMAYPVVTFCRGRTHYYLQDDTLRVRSPDGLIKKILTPDEQARFVTTRAAIDADIFRQVRPLTSGGTHERMT